MKKGSLKFQRWKTDAKINGVQGYVGLLLLDDEKGLTETQLFKEILTSFISFIFHFIILVIRLFLINHDFQKKNFVDNCF